MDDSPVIQYFLGIAIPVGMYFGAGRIVSFTQTVYRALWRENE